MKETESDRDRWIRDAKKQKAKYVVSVCDTFSYEDYPVYCKDEDELSEAKSKYGCGKNMQRINEVITIELDKKQVKPKMYSMDEVSDTILGKKGTKQRDAAEAELAKEIKEDGISKDRLEQLSLIKSVIIKKSVDLMDNTGKFVRLEAGTRNLRVSNPGGTTDFTFDPNPTKRSGQVVRINTAIITKNPEYFIIEYMSTNEMRLSNFSGQDGWYVGRVVMCVPSETIMDNDKIIPRYIAQGQITDRIITINSQIRSFDLIIVEHENKLIGAYKLSEMFLL
jgi:hypothetical protein